MPRFVILRAEAKPADLLALSAPLGHTDVKRGRKTVAVKRALYLGRNLLLDWEPEERLLVYRGASAHGALNAKPIGFKTCLAKLQQFCAIVNAQYKWGRACRLSSAERIERLAVKKEVAQQLELLAPPRHF